MGSPAVSKTHSRNCVSGLKMNYAGNATSAMSLSFNVLSTHLYVSSNVKLQKVHDTKMVEYTLVPNVKVNEEKDLHPSDQAIMQKSI